MRSINKADIGEKLSLLLDEEHPVDEYIGIIDKEGTISGVVISKEAYVFFLRKLEEEEDRIDNETIKEFHASGEKKQYHGRFKRHSRN